MNTFLIDLVPWAMGSAYGEKVQTELNRNYFV